MQTDALNLDLDNLKQNFINNNKEELIDSLYLTIIYKNGDIDRLKKTILDRSIIKDKEAFCNEHKLIYKIN